MINSNSNTASIYFSDNATNGNLVVNGINSCGSGKKSPELPITVNTCNNEPLQQLNIPNSFSPNGDGINDFLVIDGIPENSHLIIFNRKGKILFESENYRNDWDGKDQDGNVLETGTYWYVLKLGGIPNNLTGFIYLKK